MAGFLFLPRHYGTPFANITVMKHELLLNGRDTTIDASFFIDNLNADRENIVTDEFGSIRIVEFHLNGSRYLAWWRTYETTLHIVPQGKARVKDFGKTSLALMKMGVKLKNTDFDGLGVKICVGLYDCSFKPELRITFYEEL